jgi:hypothetical protein
MKEELRSSETLDLTRSTLRNIPEGAILGKIINFRFIFGTNKFHSELKTNERGYNSKLDQKVGGGQRLDQTSERTTQKESFN